MPQMSPYNWLLLFNFFTIILIFFMSYFNYYYYYNNNNYKLMNYMYMMNKFNFMW